MVQFQPFTRPEGLEWPISDKKSTCGHRGAGVSPPAGTHEQHVRAPFALRQPNGVPVRLANRTY